MASKSQRTTTSQKKSKSSLSKTNVVKLAAPMPIASLPLKRLDPLTAFQAPWVATGEESRDESKAQAKAKTKTKTKTMMKTQTKMKTKTEGNKNINMQSPGSWGRDDRLWIDIYEPVTEAELAVHPRKVEDVRRWLNEAFEGGPSGNLTKYRKILALTGPAGTAKTTTIRILAREMEFEIMEWRNATSDSFLNRYGAWPGYQSIIISLIFPFEDVNSSSTSSENISPSVCHDHDYEALFSKFEAFLNRASSCQNIFSSAGDLETRGNLPLSQLSQPSRNQRSPYLRTSLQRSTYLPGRHIVLLEDLPNLLHSETRSRFHAALQSLVKNSRPNLPVPVVIILSDAGLRGEASDERMANGGGRTKDQDGVMDIWTVLSRDLLSGPYVSLIGFNPIAPTLLHKALQRLLKTHFESSNQAAPPLKEVLDLIVESANGDIRSAVMALQFACVVEWGDNKKTRKRDGAESGAATVLKAVTRREQSLALFHLMGKVLHNKRKGDTPGLSSSPKDIQREKEIDARLKDPPTLLPHLQNHERRASRVDVETLYADSPIDSSLYSLYIQQNYPQFCDSIEQCGDIADWLSWVDSSGGEAWHQANPYRFHLLTMGILHSLPSPVARRSQRFFKPAFFDSLQKEKNAWDGVRDVKEWLAKGTSGVSGWSQADVAIELGGILKASEFVGSSTRRPPKSHRLFSILGFSSGEFLGGMDLLSEGDMGAADAQDNDSDEVSRKSDGGGGWLDSDDIEDF